ncbi:Rad4-domain-containing protein [Xylariaceae sp. FL0594]|nr:Rad4-domain-containing protein [Xylariaceae sp. FL0594]
MAGRKRKEPSSAATASASSSTRATRSTRSRTAQNAAAIPDVYRDMLLEANVQATGPATAEPPAKKRKRPGQRSERLAQRPKSPVPVPVPVPVRAGGTTEHEALPRIRAAEQNDDEDEEEDEELEFEDVFIPTPTIETVYRDSEDEDEDEDLGDDDMVFEDVDFSAHANTDTSKDLVLDLSSRSQSAAASKSKAADRRKPINKAEKERRMEIHRLHLLCLLAHVARRNKWCNDAQVQESLRSLLSQKMVKLLNPPSHLHQFGQANSMKEGLAMVNNAFVTKYRITERGMRRALWAETEEQLQNYELPEDSESPLEKSDFREAAKSLSGSRDVGAQLYCALLRAAGVEARLVCSLQPLSFSSGGPYMGNSRKKKGKLSLEEKYGQLFKPDAPEPSLDSRAPLPPRMRLGHPDAAAYRLPETGPAPTRQVPAPKKISESPYPVYWVEILDEGHQKWQPTDALVTKSFWKPQKFEPPASDRENCMAYVVAFEEDGTVKDVTRRYAKAYNAKTRKLRVDGVLTNGARWWRKALNTYAQRLTSDLDQIEANELAAIEAREPMPRNIADFKDHPVYALERHLRRNEVLVPNATPSGTVGAGSKAPLEKVYRRRDVRIARSREKWYRLGREVRPNEIPVKFLVKTSQLHEDLFSEDAQLLQEGEINGTPIYTIDQTELYRAPPVVDGRVPKNRYGNLDLYVPSMVPEGGVHIVDDDDDDEQQKLATRAAFTLGIDYAPALTGFRFSGRKGTAVIRGVVVAAEHEEAVRAVMAGIRDQEAEMESERRTRRALRAWRTFLANLRIRQRIWAGVEEEEEEEEQAGNVVIEEDVPEEPMKSLNDSDSDSGNDVADTGGGFEVDDEYMGGFM